MHTLLALEHIATIALSLFLFLLLPFAWWWYPVLLLTPDISMAGYVYNTRVGAWIYNLLHHLATGIGAYTAGYFLSNHLLALAGVIVIGHIGIDRLLGYGLKYKDSFKHTHLGKL